MVPIEEIANPKNNFNLNPPRYIDSTEPEDLLDIDGHLRGGIPQRDLYALETYWQVFPSVRSFLLESAARPDYARLKPPLTEVKRAILEHPEFSAFQQKAGKVFKELIETIAENLLAALEQQLDEMREEHGGENGLLVEVIEGESDKQKITTKAVTAPLKESGNDPLYGDERAAVERYADLVQQQSEFKANLKVAQDDLDKKINVKYPKLTEAEIKSLVVDDERMARLSASVQSEVDRVSGTLNGHIRQLAERYATPLPALVDKLETLSTRVNEHFKTMSAMQRVHGLRCRKVKW